MVDASAPFRFRFAPNAYGRNTGLGMHRLGTQGLVGSRDRNLLSNLYPHRINNPLTGESHLNKRSYADLQCRGIYDASIFARLERVCEDCYNLYKDDEVLGLCRYFHNTMLFANFKNIIPDIKLSIWTFQNFVIAELTVLDLRLLENAYNLCCWTKSLIFTWSLWKSLESEKNNTKLR